MAEETIIPLGADPEFQVRSTRRMSAEKLGVQATIQGNCVTVNFSCVEDGVSVSLLRSGTSAPLHYEYIGSAMHARLQLPEELPGEVELRVRSSRWGFLGTLIRQ